MMTSRRGAQRVENAFGNVEVLSTVGDLVVHMHLML
jgi:hypothetical protein